MKYLAYVLSMVILISCTKTENQKKVILETKEESKLISQKDAFEIISTDCYVCHSPVSISHDNLVAPPLVAVKMRYKKQFTTRVDFINGMTQFLDKPDEHQPIMKGAVKEKGKMMDLFLTKGEARAISEYIYDNTLAVPDWFPEHYKEKHGEEFKQ